MTATSLQETIENFQTFILQNDRQIEKEVVGETKEICQERLDVYYQAYSLRLMETMAHTYPVIQILAGEELFDRIGREYTLTYPSNHYSIRMFGRHFGKFLATHSEAQPGWVEMAEFEWALGEVIDAPDSPQITIDDLSTLSPEAWSDLTLKTHSTLQHHSFLYPTPALWQSVQQKIERPQVLCKEKPENWIIWRFQLRSLFTAISSEQLTMLQAIQSGQTFSEVCATLCDLMSEDQVVTFVAQTLRQWINEGIFSEFKA